LPIVSLPISSDPFQPIRAAVLGLAIVAVAAASRTAHLPGLPYRRIAVVSIIVAGAGLLVSAVINGAASSVFGVAGRFQGLVSAIGIVGAVGVGLFVAPRVRDLTALLALAVSAEAVVVIAERLGSGAADGTSGNPVLSAGWLAVAVAVVAAGARTTRGRSAAVRWVAVVAGIAAIGMLGSRGAWLAVLLGLVPVLVSLKSRLRVIVVVGAAVMLVSAALAGGPETVAKLNPAALLRSSAAARTEILGGTTRLIAENPLVGVGPGRFLYEFTAYQTAEFAQIEPGDVRPDQAHSIPLQAAAEGGVPVALSGIALFAVALQAAWRGMRRREPSCQGCWHTQGRPSSGSALSRRTPSGSFWSAWRWPAPGRRRRPLAWPGPRSPGSGSWYLPHRCSTFGPTLRICLALRLSTEAISLRRIGWPTARCGRIRWWTCTAWLSQTLPRTVRLSSAPLRSRRWSADSILSR
jgi:hypothetical protein